MYVCISQMGVSSIKSVSRAPFAVCRCTRVDVRLEGDVKIEWESWRW
jgi:hypothetical protein